MTRNQLRPQAKLSCLTVAKDEDQQRFRRRLVQWRRLYLDLLLLSLKSFRRPGINFGSRGSLALRSSLRLCRVLAERAADPMHLLGGICFVFCFVNGICDEVRKCLCLPFWSITEAAVGD